MKTMMKNIKFAVSALAAEKHNTEIAECHLPAIASARDALSMARGVDVIEGLFALVEAGTPVTIDLRDRSPRAQGLDADEHRRRKASGR